MHTKRYLPSKVCACCQKPFVWRKKWQRNWPYVKYCSRRCASTKVAPTNKNSIT
ncbi:DUF2256 domain-containing protein [Vibrio methylphosphonaticus]|uniref:DUF2256 domain-containing protein n=1 Tax=Vibrio methylphosphonaticus TaxID=2946866 RepID=UPI002029EB29|nr:DUF2256 domain-containing protein [Vibrio methylphosphonaticus]MCL9775353.1 DUF2256 domain-containing protein [Vibrio methylphosphonaticus]